MSESAAQRYWNERSVSYDAQIGGVYEEAYRKTVEKLLPYLAPDARVLDFACGTGIVTLPIARRVARVVAVDISDEMLRRCEEKCRAAGAENVTALQCGLLDPRLEEGSFDAVLACNVLLYLEERPRALARIRSLLKPDGVLLAVSDCLGEGFTPEREKKRRQVAEGKLPYVAFDTMQGLTQEVAAAGFTVVETENLFPAPPNLFLAARKEA